MNRTARRKAASLAEIDLGLPPARRVEPHEETDQPAEDAGVAEGGVEETLGKIAAIIRGLERC